MTNQEPASILLIDDHPMLRTGVKQLVSMAPDITVVGEASNGEQGIELAESLDPDLILLDLNMPGMNGLETLDKLREKSLSGRIVVFSVSNHEEDVVTALKRGSSSGNATSGCTTASVISLDETRWPFSSSTTAERCQRFVAPSCSFQAGIITLQPSALLLLAGDVRLNACVSPCQWI